MSWMGLNFNNGYLEKNNKKTPKLLIVGSARHGKDSMAEILHKSFGLKYIGSSQACADIFIYEELKDKYGYKTPEECFEDRVNHREEWHNMIADYNKDDKARLGKEILKESDCYVGMRAGDEIKECLRQGIFDLIIWVDASERIEPEGPESFNIDISCADIIIQNNGTEEEFRNKVIKLGKTLFK